MFGRALFGRAVLALALAAAAAGGCAGRGAPLPVLAPGVPVEPDPDRLRAALAALDGASASAADSFVVLGFRAAGLTPLFGGRHRLGPAEVPLAVAAFLPGARPGARDTLVVVAALAEGTAGAALLEAAWQLAARARLGGGDGRPQRSVLVVFLLPFATGPPDADGAARLLAVLAAPPWAPGALTHVVAVGPWAEAAGPVAQARALPFTAVAAPPGGDPVAGASALTLAVVDAVRAAARPPDAPIHSVLDTTLAR